MADSFKFQLFVSYTRTPDGALAREIERFLEAFDRTPLRPDVAVALMPLQICVDGSDFSLPPIEAGGSEEARRDVLSVVYEHLAMSRELLVLCSARAAGSDWVAKEIRWFLEHRGPGAIRVAFTEGTQPWTQPETYFPPPILQHALHEGIAYDLRGYDARRSSGWTQVPEFQREMVRLAADLMGLSAGDLYPTWLEAELERARRQSLTLASTARFETLAGDPSRALLTAYEAHELHPGEVTEVALSEAYKVAVLHHHNRREFTSISGSGPSYLAGRWKQGEVFTKTSPDGKYRLLVTERGKDGPSPPGDVYLVSNETLRAVKLQPLEGQGGRVEEVGFDRTSQFVFVTRYFNLAVYANDGRYVGQYEFSRHTKSPVHLVDGFFGGRYILGAETKGGVWLIDLNGDPDSTLTVLSEFHRDATIFTDISRDGQRALLVFESGRAALLALDGNGRPKLTDIAQNGVLFAGFAAGREDMVITSADDGSIVLWDLAGDAIGEVARMKPLPSPADWVSLDDSAIRLAAVGANQKVYILDRASGELLSTLDYSDAIDWAAVRAIAVPRRMANPGPAEDFGSAMPFPPPDLLVSNLQRIDDITWMFTEDWTENEYYAKRAAYRVDGLEAKLLPGVHAEFAEKHVDLLWMRVGVAYGGAAFRHRDNYLRRFPTKEIEVTCLHEKDGVVWVGTRLGAYRHDAHSSRLVTPENLNIQSIDEIGGRLWIRATEGAYLLEDDRLVRVTEPFLNIRYIKKAGGAVWILTKTQEIFDSDGPAHRVRGYFSSPLPSAKSKVSDVIEAGTAAWLAEAGRIHRVEGDDVHTITGLVSNVDDIVQVGRTLWLTTHSRGLFASRQQSYRMDADALAPEALDIKGWFVRAAGHTWLQYWKDGRFVLAEPREDGLRDLNLGAGPLTAVAQRNGEPWFLTTAGALRESNHVIVSVDAPELPYYALINDEESFWLLSVNAAVRVNDGGATVLHTGAHKPRAIRHAGGHIWILTNDMLDNAGPAYRVARTRATAVTPPEGGIANVIELDGEAWLLTKKGSRAGLLRKA